MWNKHKPEKKINKRLGAKHKKWVDAYNIDTVMYNIDTVTDTTSTQLNLY